MAVGPFFGLQPAFHAAATAGNEGAVAMKIETRKEDSAVVVAPSGRLDRAGARALEAKLYAAARQGGGRAVLDCGGIAYISCAGLRALLLGAKACVQEGGELAVAALRPECRALLEASGLLSVLQYHETAEAALNGTGRPRRKAVRDGMEIGERHEAHAVVLSLVGQLNGDGASLLLARIANAIEHGIFRVALDCTGMSYVNSAGLRALLIGAKECRQAGGDLAIAALAPQCRSVMEMSGFLTVIDYRETLEAALAMLDRE